MNSLLVVPEQSDGDAFGRLILLHDPAGHEAWNGTIAPGASIQIGFMGTGTLTRAGNCALNGSPCGISFQATAGSVGPLSSRWKRECGSVPCEAASSARS